MPIMDPHQAVGPAIMPTSFASAPKRWPAHWLFPQCIKTCHMPNHRSSPNSWSLTILLLSADWWVPAIPTKQHTDLAGHVPNHRSSPHSWPSNHYPSNPLNERATDGMPTDHHSHTSANRAQNGLTTCPITAPCYIVVSSPENHAFASA